MGKVNKDARHKERAMSVDQWNPTKRLTYDVNSLPQRESRSRRQMTSGYGTGHRPHSSDDDMSRRHKSEARRSPPKAQHSHGSVTDRCWSSTAQHGSYRQGKEEAKPSHSGLPRESSPDHFVTCAEYNRWRTVDQLAHLKAALTGDAGEVLWDTYPVAIDSLSKLTTLLRSRFSGSRQADKCKMDLKLRRRKPGESLTSLHEIYDD